MANQDETSDIFSQFGDAQTPTLYYANGTDADALNTGTQEFGGYSTGQSVPDTRIVNPWDPSLPENRGGYSGYKYPIDNYPSFMDQLNKWFHSSDNTLLYIGLAVAAIVFVPPLLNRR